MITKFKSLISFKNLHSNKEYDEKNNCFLNFIISIFYLLLAVFPFASGLIVATRYYSKYQYFKFEYLLVMLIFSWILLEISQIKFNSKHLETKTIIFIFVITFVIRWFAMSILNTEPTSDFGHAITSAINHMNGPIYDLHSGRFPYWGFFRITLSFIFNIFGASLQVAKLFNIFLACFTSLGIYFLGKKVFTSKKLGLITALVYIFLPADIFYKNLPTGEHIFIMLFPFSCLVFQKFLEIRNRNAKISLILILMTGILIGIMEMYKPVAIILLIAFSITIFFQRDYQFLPKQKSFNILKIISNTLFVIVLLFSFLTVKKICYMILKSQILSTPNQYGFGTALRVGLDPNTNGEYDKELAIYLRDTMTQNDENYEIVNSIFLDEVFVIIQNNDLITFLNLFKNKFAIAWRTERDFSNWPTIKQIDNDFSTLNPRNLEQFYRPFNDAYYIFQLFFSFLGALFCVKNCRNDITLSLGLYIFGFSMLLLLTEVQIRYRSVLFSSTPIFFVYGLCAIKEIFSKVKIKKKINFATLWF